jgi:hypothetical protein
LGKDGSGEKGRCGEEGENLYTHDSRRITQP